MKLLLSLLAASALWAQQSGTPVQVVQYPKDAPTLKNIYDASNNLIYVCYAKAIAPNDSTTNYNFSLSVTATTLTSIVVATNVGTITTAAAHGWRPNQLVTVTGSTTSALNGTYRLLTTATSTTATVTTSGVANATYNNGALTVAGAAPLTTKPIWSIMALVYDASNNLTDRQWAGGNASSYGYICDNAAVSTGATKITYK